MGARIGIQKSELTPALVLLLDKPLVEPSVLKGRPRLTNTTGTTNSTILPQVTVYFIVTLYNHGVVHG